MTPPPHLPPKTGTADPKHFSHVVPWILGMLAMAALTSIATALVIVTLFWPSAESQNSIIIGRTGQSTVASADPNLVRQVRQSMLTIYDATEKIGDQFYTDDARVGSAAVLSSDGWAVLYENGPLPFRNSGWEVVDGQGVVHPILDIVSDSVSGLTYIRIETEGLRVAAFPSWEEGTPASAWAVRQSTWTPTLIEQEALGQSGASQNISSPFFALTLDPAVDAGSVLLSEGGQLIGFANSTGEVIPSWMIQLQLGNILAGESISYLGLPYRGALVSTVVQDDAAQPLSGFYVTNSPTRTSSTTVGIGDVIVAVDGVLVQPPTLDRQILTAGPEPSLTIFRDGQELDVVVEKTSL